MLPTLVTRHSTLGTYHLVLHPFNWLTVLPKLQLQLQLQLELRELNIRLH